MPAPAVFSDPTGRRWPRLRIAATVAAVLATLLLTLFVFSVLSNPFLPRFKLPQVQGLPRATKVAPPPAPLKTVPPPRAVERSLAALRRAERHAPVRPSARPQNLPVAPVPLAPPPPLPDGRRIAAGFYVNWDDSSYASLKRNLARLDWVIPEWARLDSAAFPATGAAATGATATGALPSPLRVTLDPRALDLMRREGPSVRVLPLVQNYHDDDWDGALATSALATAEARTRLVAALTAMVASNGFSGVVLDFEELPAAVQPNLLAFVDELHRGFRARGWLVGEAVPFDDDDWSYAAHAAVTDYLFLMAYDQHYATGGPGPLAAQSWFEQHLGERLRVLDPARVLVCIGAYGYDWTAGESPATVISFEEGVRAAHDSGAPVVFDRDSRNPVVRYDDEDGAHHQAWFLDAATAYDEMQAAARAHVAGFALWRLGVEDPSLWSIYGPGAPTAGPDTLGPINFPYDVDFDGAGELLQVTAEPRPGARTLVLDGKAGDPERAITDERFLALPSSYEIRRTGDRPGLVALTFDDGPDPRYTPQILDLLARAGVHASFFVIGEKGAERPDLLRRIVAEGHDLGNHTYTHPNLGETSALVTDVELNATQRLLEAATGRGTTLFRAPYFGDAEPQTPDEVEPIVRAQKLGYFAVGLRIDPGDWALPGKAEIVRRTVVGATGGEPESRGHIVLLHDGGGDRSQTVAALPELIDGLQKAGVRLVPVSELAGLTRDQAMPPAVAAERLYRYSDSVAFVVFSTATWLLHWLFVLGLVLGLVRILSIAVLALVERLRRGPPAAPPAVPRKVSILVPAFNEEKVIARTLESLLASTYPDFEIIVIDDGSKDRTFSVVTERFGSDARVRAYTKPNGGKAEALAFGLERSSGEIIVALDADTLFPPEVLAELCAPFADERVGAVAGNAKVGNRVNLVTRWQALEYVSSQNLDRRAFALLDCITVVPGAVGAWRRDVVTALGGFGSDTLAEDQDLTIKVRRRGYRIAYAERAVAYTEAPDTLRALAKQRYRWSFGTLQCMWKHRGALFSPRHGALGFVAMPSVWLFQILFPLLAPLVDLLFVGALVWAGLERIEHPAARSLAELEPVLFYYAFFLAVDWLSSAFSFLLEPREQWSLLGWFLLQRLCYRQVMYYVMLKSVMAGLRGGVVGWGKLERKATVAY